LAALASVALFAVWFLPANAATRGDFFRLAVGHHIVDRVAEPMEHHGGGLLLSLPYYLPVVLVCFSPWTLYLPAGVCALLTGSLGERLGAKLLLASILTRLGVPTVLSAP